ncbi:MAG: BatD family protein [Campylobacterales bacterium]|nr:BatD family protein [Campylobacterales bacterium]
MKRTPGRELLWILLLLPLFSWAVETTYTWSAAATKTRVAQHEAFAVEYTCRFDSEAYAYIIAFDPVRETEAYRIEPQNSEEQIVDGHRVNRYRFTVFPKIAGPLSLAFSATMEQTTKASIENAVMGRDNVEKLDYTARTVSLPVIDVAVAPQQTPYAGHLSLSLVVDRETVDAFTPVQVAVRLDGYGNLDTMVPFALNIPGARQFTDGEAKALRLGDNGYEGSIGQQFAIVSDRNFTVPALQLSYYDTEQQRTVTLTTEPHTVAVRSAADAAADEAKPAPSGEASVEWNASWLHLLLALLAGVVIGRFLLPVRVETEAASLPEKLRGCSDPKHFAAYLAMADAEGYREMIDAIEAKLKAGERVDLSAYKRQL